MWPSSAVAIFCVAIARSDGESDGTRIGSFGGRLEPAVRQPVDGERNDRRAVLGGEDRRSGRQRRPGPEHLHGDAVRAVAPVHEEDEGLTAAQGPEDAPEVPPGDHLHAPAFALALEELVQLAIGAVVAHDVDLQAVLGEPGRGGLVVAEMGRDQDHALGGLVDLEELVVVVDFEQVLHLLALHPRQPHQLQDVAGVVEVGGACHLVRGLVVGVHAEHVPEVGAEPAPALRAGGVADQREPRADPVDESTGQMAHDPR